LIAKVGLTDVDLNAKKSLQTKPNQTKPNQTKPNQYTFLQKKRTIIIVNNNTLRFFLFNKREFG